MESLGFFVNLDGQGVDGVALSLIGIVSITPGRLDVLVAGHFAQVELANVLVQTQPRWEGVFVIIMAWLGRMMWHVRKVQGQRRKFFSLHLMWELMTAICTGFLAAGVAEWVGLSGVPETALIIVISYLWPPLTEPSTLH